MSEPAVRFTVAEIARLVPGTVRGAGDGALGVPAGVRVTGVPAGELLHALRPWAAVRRAPTATRSSPSDPREESTS